MKFNRTWWENKEGPLSSKWGTKEDLYPEYIKNIQNSIGRKQKPKLKYVQKT